ncbi:sialate O-acetylesterase [Echinicola sp. 20G]|uniref:sialate O-acetylesterase n=1 Tax=Echinicola sp. 20G TaxID=2781961 RepID=UPI001910AC37|nr:sialate O-acetylesterase [Echinicola sp. 20G]
MILSKQIPRCLIFLLILCSSTIQLRAEIRLPHLISDGMVLQRNQEIRIWGWADEGETVQVEFQEFKECVVTKKDGMWEAFFPAMKEGGPYFIDILGKDNHIHISDIWFGDVWICSGQSNMEQTMARVEPMFPDEVKKANNPAIRYFDVRDDYNFENELLDVKGGKWISASQNDIKQFSAVAYFFAQKVHEKYNVPIGLINASVGGSPIQSWIREDELNRFPKDYKEAVRFQNPNLIKEIEQRDRERRKDWLLDLRKKDQGYSNPKEYWYDINYKPENWEDMARLNKLPVVEGKYPENGVYWFRKEFFIQNKSAEDMEAYLLLGTIVDSDSVYINGQFVGATAYQYPPRRYSVNKNVLRHGKNVLVARVINERGLGGFVKDKPYQIELNGEIIDLKYDWKYKQGAAMPALPEQTFIRFKPLGLYNAMIAPLKQFSVKGVLWYQGESNVGEAYHYKEQMAALIEGWRKAWDKTDLPFLFVQLPNFMTPSHAPHSGTWPQIREAQRKTLEIQHTGMAVTIDVGEANDIHPLNKKTVGERLALQAFKIAYGETKGVFSGPTIKKAEISNDMIILSFEDVGGGLVTSGAGYPDGFAISGQDGEFKWARAKILENKIILECNDITDPKKVSYGWANNPDRANLYNLEGLPASPFEIEVE